MKLSRALLVLLGLLVLSSQHVAVNHALWHAFKPTGGGELTIQTDPDRSAPAARSLCDFDAMLGQLLGAGPVTGHRPQEATGTVPSGVRRLPSYVTSERLRPPSRGPPTLL